MFGKKGAWNFIISVIIIILIIFVAAGIVSIFTQKGVRSFFGIGEEEDTSKFVYGSETTTQSFNNLEKELKELKSGEKTIDIEIEAGFYLKTLCEKKNEADVKNDICICGGKGNCEERIMRKSIDTVNEVELINSDFISDGDKKLKIVRVNKKITIEKVN